MEREVELAIIRQAYAKQILALTDIADPRIGAAFAYVRREPVADEKYWLRGEGWTLTRD